MPCHEMNLQCNLYELKCHLVHFFYSYLGAVAGEEGREETTVHFYVPTGAAGNLTAGAIARQMGLLHMQLIACTNANDVLARVSCA